MEFFDGNTTSSPSLGKFCGSDGVPNIVSSTGSLTVRFFSDASGGMDVGFKIELEAGKILIVERICVWTAMNFWGFIHMPVYCTELLERFCSRVK